MFGLIRSMDGSLCGRRVYILIQQLLKIQSLGSFDADGFRGDWFRESWSARRSIVLCHQRYLKLPFMSTFGSIV